MLTSKMFTTWTIAAWYYNKTWIQGWIYVITKIPNPNDLLRKSDHFFWAQIFSRPKAVTAVKFDLDEPLEVEHGAMSTLLLIIGWDWGESQLWLIAQRFIALGSIPALPNSSVIWLLAMMSPMPKSSINLMSHLGTVPRALITTGRMAVSTWWIFFSSNARSWYFYTFQSFILTTLQSLGIQQYQWLSISMIISGLFCVTVISVWIVRPYLIFLHDISACVCSYHLSEVSSPCFLHNSQWTLPAKLSCLLLYCFCASLGQPLLL